MSKTTNSTHSKKAEAAQVKADLTTIQAGLIGLYAMNRGA